MTNLFIDCEFNGFGGDLLSMGVATIQGNNFYEVIMPDDDITYDKWVAENVAPVFNKEWIPKDEFQKKLCDYMKQFSDIRIIADWPDDIKYFCESLITGPEK